MENCIPVCGRVIYVNAALLRAGRKDMYVTYVDLHLGLLLFRSP